MDVLSLPAVVMRKYSGCRHASSVYLVMVAKRSRVCWAKSSSKIRPDTLKPCLDFVSEDSTR